MSQSESCPECLSLYSVHSHSWLSSTRKLLKSSCSTQTGKVSLPHLLRSLNSQWRCWGPLVRLWFRGRLSLRKHKRQGAGSLHVLTRDPSRGSPGRALLFAHRLLKLRKALKKYWDWLGLWRSRQGPGKQNKGSSLLLLLVIAHCQSWIE